VGIEQRGERAEDARLCLAAKAEEDEVVLAEDSVDDLGDDRVFITDDAGEERGLGLSGGAEFRDEILTEFIFDAASKADWGEFAGAERA
jgi:hypothetical protein